MDTNVEQTNSSGPALPGRETLTDVLGRKRVEIPCGPVIKTVVRQFRLKQVDDVKALIFQVIEQSEVTRIYKDTTEGGDGKEIEYKTQDLRQGFLKSKNLIPQFLAFCCSIKYDKLAWAEALADDDLTDENLASGPTLGDLSLDQTMEAFEWAMELNGDFFRKSLDFVTKGVAFFAPVQKKVRAMLDNEPEEAEAKAPMNSNANISSGADADLLQSDKPVGERLPQLYSVTPTST